MNSATAVLYNGKWLTFYCLFPMKNEALCWMFDLFLDAKTV